MGKISNETSLVNPILKEFIDLVVSAHCNLNHPDMGGQNYRNAKSSLEKAHRLIPKVLRENLNLSKNSL